MNKKFIIIVVAIILLASLGFNAYYFLVLPYLKSVALSGYQTALAEEIKAIQANGSISIPICNKVDENNKCTEQGMIVLVKQEVK